MSIVFVFSWDYPISQEKLKTMLMQNLGGQTKNIMVFSEVAYSIDLFGFYILFSHFRPRDATRGNSFFQMSSYARTNLRITNEKTKGKFP